MAHKLYRQIQFVLNEFQALTFNLLTKTCLRPFHGCHSVTFVTLKFKIFLPTKINKCWSLLKITLYTSNYDNTILIPIGLFFISKNRKSLGVTFVFILLFILVEIVIIDL